MSEEKLSSKALRLAGVLSRHADDNECVQKMAKALNYVPSVLAQDMNAILAYIYELEDKIKKYE